MKLVISNSADKVVDLRKEATLGIVYFIAYFSYLFVNPENEFMHWLTLLGYPLLFLFLYLGQGIPAGIVLGVVYVPTQNNLVASIIVHSMMNALPAMTMIKFQRS